MSPELVLTVSDFVAVFNQTVEYAYPNVTITGELANYRVSKNRWVYFDLKDETSILKFFGTIYQLPGPLENGMMLQVKGMPRLHPLYGFSVTISNIQLTGEGSIKKAAALLQAKLAKEGLFDIERKRVLPYPPGTIGLITSAESAAFRDFIKVINARWGGMDIILADVQVQGDAATNQIVGAISNFNQSINPPDVIVITRGGGSAEDMQTFNTEQVTRAVASSRIPTIVAIGHEIDTCLAELAADKRASTPSNAAELLVPDKKAVLLEMKTYRDRLGIVADRVVKQAYRNLVTQIDAIGIAAANQIVQASRQLSAKKQLLYAFSPQTALERGYALVQKGNTIVRSGDIIAVGDTINVQLIDADITAIAKQVKMRNLNGKETS